MRKCSSYYILKELHFLHRLEVVVGYRDYRPEDLIVAVSNYIISLLQEVSRPIIPFNSGSNFEPDLNRDSFVVNHLNEYFPIPFSVGVQIVSRVRFLIISNIFPYGIDLERYLPPELISSPRYDEKLIQEVGPWLFSGRPIRKRYIRLLTATFYYAYREVVPESSERGEEALIRLLESPFLFVLLGVYNLRLELADDILKN